MGVMVDLSRLNLTVDFQLSEFSEFEESYSRNNKSDTSKAIRCIKLTLYDDYYYFSLSNHVYSSMPLFVPFHLIFIL